MKELNDKYVDLLFDKDICMLHVKFHKYVPLDRLLKINEQGYEIIRASKVDNCLINLKQLPVHDTESSEYINTTWFPTVKKPGSRFIAFVLPDSALGKLSSKNAHKNAEVINGLVINNFSDEAEARKWLKSLNS